MQKYCKITSKDVKKFAHSLLLDTLGFVSLTLFTSAKLLIDMLLLAATSRSSIEQITKNSKKSPSGKTIREHTRKQLSSVQDVENRLNASLQQTLPKFLKKAYLPIAIDLFEIPYYGKVDDENQKAVRRIPRKNGTSRCHAYATAYCILKGKRYTLAIAYVEKGEKMLSVLRRLNARLSQLRIKQKYYLLDRGFYAVDVMKWLILYCKPFIIPAKMTPKASKELGKHKSSRWVTYQIKSPKSGTLKIEMAVHCFNKREKGKKKGRRKSYVYATWGFEGKPIKWIKETYRKRFGIEVSHRQRNEMKIKTCTRDEKVRYLYVGIGFILRNIWVLLHWEVFSSTQRGAGGKRLNLDVFSIERMKSWLRSELEFEYVLQKELYVSLSPHEKIPCF